MNRFSGTIYIHNIQILTFMDLPFAVSEKQVCEDLDWIFNTNLRAELSHSATLHSAKGHIVCSA